MLTEKELAQLGLKRGDLLVFRWADICEDSVGDTAVAQLAIREQTGHFWETKVDETGLTIMVTCSTLDDAGPAQQGWQATPLACLLSVEVVRRRRRKREGTK